MDFMDSMPITFKEITLNQKIPDKWKEVALNTGGTHSTLQDIKLPPKAGGYWYKPSKKANTTNRFLYWQTTADAIEFSEASLDVNLSSAHLRCKVAPGTPPLSGLTVWERPLHKEVIILAATVSSVHRLVFPHPEVLDRKATFGSLSGSTPSIFYDTTSINNPNNYHILTQYSNTSTGVAHTCSSLLRDTGEAVFALSFGHGGEGSILLVKLPLAGPAVTCQLKKESTVPRFLSGITGALRGKGLDGIESYGVVIHGGWSIAICGDACLRAWSLDDAAAPPVLSQPLSLAQTRPKPPPHGHMLQKAETPDGSIILVAYLSFPNECEFVVMKMHDGGPGAIKFANICRIFGPPLDLLDYNIGFGEGNNVIWALWSQPDGETIITCSTVGVESEWRGACPPRPPPPLPQLSSHQQYRDKLMARGLFPPSLIGKAIAIYRRTWGGGGGGGGGGEAGAEGELGEAAAAAVQARMRHLSARAAQPDHPHLMHKCWSDLYSWCLQYMEGLQKPLGIMVNKNVEESNNGCWSVILRRSGISLVRELEPLERIMLSPDINANDLGKVSSWSSLSVDAVRIAWGGARWSRWCGGTDEVSARVLTPSAPQHRLLPRLAHLLASSDHLLTPQLTDELTSILEPIKDLQSAMLELNDALRLDVPEIDTSKEEEEASEYDSLLASDLGVALLAESIKQMAEIRSSVVGGAAACVVAGRGAGAVPGAGHCAVHWQAYRALLWLCDAPTHHHTISSPEEAFRLKLSVLGLEPRPLSIAGGVVAAYISSVGGRRARRALAGLVSLRWHDAAPLLTYRLAHNLWAVSGSFEFGEWMASINRPRLLQSYVTLLEPWCEWNACSRQFILGLALLDLEDAQGAYKAFIAAAKGVGSEPFLRQLAEATTPLTQQQALLLYYMKVIKLFEIHEAGACVVRLAETAISIADNDDPNLTMFQWVVFKWHLSGGRVERALSAAAASPAPSARAAAAAALLQALAPRHQLGLLVRCGALAEEAARAASQRARLADAHTRNPAYDYLLALHLHRHHYRRAASVLYERAARCAAEGGGGATRRRCLAAALTALRLAKPEHAFLPRAASQTNKPPDVIGPEELAAELREIDPDAIDPVQQALLANESVDFNILYPYLKEADEETLLKVTKRVLSTGHAFPHWFIQRFLEVDSGACIRALLGGGRAVEAAAACCHALRHALRRLTACTGAPPRAAPAAQADALLLELSHHRDQPAAAEAYEDLNQLVTEYLDVVARTSEDMKLAKIQFPVATCLN